MNEYSPMLLSIRQDPFDNPDYIFEIKFDGVRCIARLNDKTTLTGRSGKDFTPLFPELADMHKFSYKECVLDGEIVVFKAGAPDFSACLSRTSGTQKSAKAAANASPAVFIAFDILELNGEALISLPLLKRKELLDQNLSDNSPAKPGKNYKSPIIKCPFVNGDGKKLFDFARQNALEGIVAKRKDSIYNCGKRTTDWLKIKLLKTEELTVFGYTKEDGSNCVRDLILGYFLDGKAVFRTKIYIGNKPAEIKKITKFALNNTLFLPFFAGFPSAVWLSPNLICTIEYLEETKDGNLRQPVFKSLLSTKPQL